jgi:hypothetical protein
VQKDESEGQFVRDCRAPMGAQTAGMQTEDDVAD